MEQRRALLEITGRYYAQWADVAESAFDAPGIVAVCSAKRDIAPKGYSKPYSFYCLVRGRAIIVSCNKAVSGELTRIAGIFERHKELAARREHLKGLYPGLCHKIAFSHSGTVPACETAGAVQLRPEHYGAYLRFFNACSPGANAETWLSGYFNSMVSRGYSFGLFKNDMLVSVSDAPEVPYLGDQVVEIGINTLEAHRGKGYARTVVAAMLEKLLWAGKTPIWVCEAANLGSERLALSVGYEKYADIFCV